MCSWKKIILMGFVLLLFLDGEAISQGLPASAWLGRLFMENTIIRNLGEDKTKIETGLDYSLSLNCLLHLNYQHGANLNQAGMNQNIRIINTINRDGNFKMTNTLVHILGFQYFFDSITQVSQDDNTLITRIDLKFFKPFTLTFNSNLSSRLINNFDLQMNDSGQQIRILNASFLTPLLWVFSWGASYNLPNFGSVNFGLTGGKLTYMWNRSIFDKRQTSTYYGVEKNKNYLLEYGLSFQLLIDRDVTKTFHWNCDLLLFKNYNTSIDMTLKNSFGLRINRFLKTSMSTKILYEENLSKHLQFENLLSV